jgi:hypothetical protein
MSQAVRLTIAENDIRLPQLNRLYQIGNFAGIVLAVCVDAHNNVGPTSKCDVESVPKGHTKALVSCVVNNSIRSGSQAFESGRIVRAIVHDKDFNFIDAQNASRDCSHDICNCFRLIESWYHNDKLAILHNLCVCLKL